MQTETTSIESPGGDMYKQEVASDGVSIKLVLTCLGPVIFHDGFGRVTVLQPNRGMQERALGYEPPHDPKVETLARLLNP